LEYPLETDVLVSVDQPLSFTGEKQNGFIGEMDRVAREAGANAQRMALSWTSIQRSSRWKLPTKR
jgi:hypothetical protein